MAAINIHENEFRERMARRETILVDYWASWCGYCRRIGPAYEKIADQYADRLTVVKINIDEDAPLAQAEKIEVIPTLVIYQDGKALSSIVAPQSKADIDTFIRQTLGELL